MNETPGFFRLDDVKRGEALEIKVDGKAIPAFAGETVATALLAAGLLSCQSHDDRALGVFCNIGQCCSCLMTIDGVSGVRACQTLVSPGLVVESRRLQKRGSRP
ncbi:MAG: (2Fe-2S)-binding protein [Deltaproteobacteria bacterium]|nr:(2Fe-2S)-binding protein [Deltaproteobacteria bacterium]